MLLLRDYSKSKDCASTEGLLLKERVVFLLGTTLFSLKDLLPLGDYS